MCPVRTTPPPPGVDNDAGSGSDSDGISPQRSGSADAPIEPEPPSLSGSSPSASSSGSSTSSDSDSEVDVSGNARRFRRIDSDDNAGAIGGPIGLFTRGVSPFGVAGGIRGLPGLAFGAANGSGHAGGGAVLPPRAGRLAESSKVRLRDALLARDPGGYKRALADKYALSSVFAGLETLGQAVADARKDGRDDVAFVLDDDRRNARRALDEALANPDEAAALERIRGVEAAIAASLDVATASAEEAAEARAAAHAALPLWKRVWDLDKDGVVSLAEKRSWVTGVMFFLITALCLTLMGLLTKSYVRSVHDPAVVLSVDERAAIELPPFTFCMQGPSFASINRTGADGERLGRYAGTIGLPLFRPRFVQRPAKPGTNRPPLDIEPFNPDLAGAVGELRELAGPRDGCSVANGSLSVNNNDSCFSCFEMHAPSQLYGGGTIEENLKSAIDVTFVVYLPYAACLADPDVLRPATIESELRAVVATPGTLAALTNVLRAPTGSSPVTADETTTLTSAQLCNVVFFSGVFYPLLHGGVGAAYIRASDNSTGAAWTEAPGAGPFLEGRHVGAGDSIDLHILPEVVPGGQRFDNKRVSHASLPGVPIGAARVGELTQVLLTKRIFEPGVQGRGSLRERRYEARVAGYPWLAPRVGGYVEAKVSVAMETFLVERFDRKSDYTFPQYLEHLSGFTANFFVCCEPRWGVPSAMDSHAVWVLMRGDISVFTLLVVPLIFAFHKRDKARKEAARAAEAAAKAAEGPNPADALGTKPILTPLAPITPGASSYYRRRRLHSSPSSKLQLSGDGSASPSVGGGVASGVGNGSLAAQMVAARSDRSLAGWILRFGRQGGRGGAAAAAPRRRPDEDSDDSLV